jgi:hypothetical protein
VELWGVIWAADGQTFALLTRMAASARFGGAFPFVSRDCIFLVLDRSQQERPQWPWIGTEVPLLD